MKKCKKCGNTEIVSYGLSSNFYRCPCGYIGEKPRKPKIVTSVEEIYETTCADDYLDYLHSLW